MVNCASCKNCFACVGLKNVKYCIFNKQYSKDKYEEKLGKLDNGDLGSFELAQQKVADLVKHEIVKHFHGFNCENVTGDYLYNCKDTFNSYDTKNCEDTNYCATVESFVDCYDCNFSPAKTELSYNCLTVEGYALLMCHSCVNKCSHLIYCDNCYACKHCFGCVGLKSKEYCIFNKQYTQTDYENLLPKLIELMIETNEWGIFFPFSLSAFAYNETIAQEYFPMSKEEALARGYRWRETEDQYAYQGPEIKVTDDIEEVSDEICDQILTCEQCNKHYKIIKQELKFYRKLGIPVPRNCPNCRHANRMALRNPRKLWDRKCDKCGKDIQTSYAPERPETVYCEECYLKEVY